MADLIKNSYNEANDFFGVVFQKGRDVMEFELNEAQRVVFGKLSRAIWAAAAYAGPEATEFVYAADDAFLIKENISDPQTILVTGANVGEGYAIAGGVALWASAVDSVVTLPGHSGPDRTDSVFIEVGEVEVDDPAEVLTNNSKRAKMAWSVIVLVEGDTLPTPGTTPLWAGGHHYYKIGEVIRHSNGTKSVVDHRRVLPQKALQQLLQFEEQNISAVVVPKIETPTEIGRQVQTLETNVGTHAAAASVLASFKVTSGSDAGRTLLEAVQTSGTQEELRVYNAVVRDMLGTLKFRDANTPSAVNFSDTDSTAGSVVSKFRRGSAACASLIRAINNTSEVVIGYPGVSLGGTSSTYLSDILGEAATAAVDLTGQVSLLDGRFKCDADYPFEYTFPDTSLGFGSTLAGGTTRCLTIEGKGTSIIEVDGLSFLVSSTLYPGKVVFKGIIFDGLNAAEVRVHRSQCEFVDCVFLNTQVHVTDPVSGVGYSAFSSKPTKIFDSVVFRNCTFSQSEAKQAILIDHVAAGDFSKIRYLVEGCTVERLGAIPSVASQHSSAGVCIALNNSCVTGASSILGSLEVVNCVVTPGQHGGVSPASVYGNYGAVGFGVLPLVSSKITEITAIKVIGCSISTVCHAIRLIPSPAVQCTCTIHDVVVKDCSVDVYVDSGRAYNIPILLSGVQSGNTQWNAVKKIHVSGLEVSTNKVLFTPQTVPLDYFVPSNADLVGIVTLRADNIYVDGLHMSGGCAYSGIPDLTIFDSRVANLRNMSVELSGVANISTTVADQDDPDFVPKARVVLQPSQEFNRGYTVDGLLFDGASAECTPSGTNTYPCVIRALPCKRMLLRNVEVKSFNIESNGASALAVLGSAFYSVLVSSAYTKGSGLTVEDSAFRMSHTSGYTGAQVRSIISETDFTLTDTTFRNVIATGATHGINLLRVYGSTVLEGCRLYGGGDATAYGFAAQVGHKTSSISITGGVITSDDVGTGDCTKECMYVAAADVTATYGVNLSMYGVDSSNGQTFTLSGKPISRYRVAHIEGIPSGDEAGSAAPFAMHGCETGSTATSRTFTNYGIMRHNGLKLSGVPIT